MHYGTESISVVKAYNPEMADMSNHSGAIWADLHYATVETPEGKIFSYGSGYYDEVEALSDCAFLEELKADPVDSKSFDFLRVAYGSEYHANNRREVERSLMDEEERYHADQNGF